MTYTDPTGMWPGLGDAIWKAIKKLLNSPQPTPTPTATPQAGDSRYSNELLLGLGMTAAGTAELDPWLAGAGLAVTGGWACYQIACGSVFEGLGTMFSGDDGLGAALEGLARKEWVERMRESPQDPPDGWEVKGSAGNWVNQETGESFHPDFDNPVHGPHVDWHHKEGGQKVKDRVFPDGRIERAK